MWKKLRARGLTLLEFSLDLVLFVLFSAQAFLAGCLLIYGYIPAPGKWTNDTLIENKLDGFYLQADQFRLKLSGKIEITGLKIYHEGISGPILEATSAVIDYSLRKEGRTQFIPTGLVLSNGTLQMPALYAPDGQRTAILEQITLHLTPKKDLLRIDSFVAKHEDIRLRGAIDWPIDTSGIKPNAVSATAHLDRLYKLIASALKEKERFSPFIEPTLEFALIADQDGSVEISAHLSCEQLKHTQATGTEFNLEAAFKLKEGRLSPQSALLVQAKEINIPGFNFAANAITASIPSDQWTGLLNGIWPDFKISAHQVVTHGIELNSPQARISPAHFPELQFTGSTSGLKGGVAFSGKLNSNNKSGQLHANGSVDVSTLIPDSILEKLPKLEFGATPYYDLSIEIKEGFEVGQASFRVDVSDLTANGLTFDHILATGSYNKGSLSLDHVLVDRSNQWIDAKFSFDHTSKDFKISLQGSAQPDQYSPILPKWWPAIFKDIEFNQDNPGYGDFVIYGNAMTKGKVFFLGHATAQKVAYKKALIDEGELIVRGYGNYIELHDIDAKTGDGWAKGDIGFTTGKIPGNGLLSVRYNFESLMPLDVAGKIFGGNVAAIISDFEVAKLPTIKINGVTFNDAYAQYANDDTFYLDADIDTPITFKKTPLDHLQLKLYSREKSIYLRDVEFGYADGNGTATLDILNTEPAENWLRFKLSLQQANQGKAIQNLPSFDDLESQLTQTEAKQDQTIRSIGIIDLNIHAQGPLNDPYQFHGYGDFMVNNKELGSIQLLGPLSNMLKNTRLNFTSLNLDQMIADFEIAQDQLKITELLLDGPLTAIRADGTFSIPDQALKMGVRVNLFANMGNPDSRIQALRKFITAPLPNFLVFDLSGTVQDQKLRLRYDPRNFIPIIKDL